MSAGPHWPSGVDLPHNPHQMTLVMVLHPMCPCSRASLAELDRLLTMQPGRINADLVFVDYASLPTTLEQSPNWRQAAAIPGVHLVCDSGGHVAHAFGAWTSGQCYLYDMSGHLVFQGGLTGGRGEEGDNVGLTTAMEVASGHTGSGSRSLVFGCPLFEPALSSGVRLRSACLNRN